MTTKHGHYFTFPLKFLHVPPGEYSERFGRIIHWAINETIRRGNVDQKASDQDKENWVREKLCINRGNTASWEKGWNELQKLITGGEIYTSVKTAYLFDARDGKLDPDLLLLVAAVRSKIGKNNFKHTNRQEIVCRMYGDPNKLKRHAFDTLCDKAYRKGMMTRISAGRGYFVSIRYNCKQLADEVIRRKAKHQMSKQERAEAGKEITTWKPAGGPETTPDTSQTTHPKPCHDQTTHDQTTHDQEYKKKLEELHRKMAIQSQDEIKKIRN